MTDWKRYLSSIYYDAQHPGSYAGPDKLYRIAKEEGKYSIGRRKIRRWLQDQEAYSLTRPAKRKFRKSRVIVEGLDSMWDVDLMDMMNLSRYNDGSKYVLVAIDIFSRYLWCEPLRSKRGGEVLTALRRIMEGPRRPETIRTDRGMEFRSKEVNKYLQERGIRHQYALNTETKANYAERVIKTLKHKLFRYLLKGNTRRYIDILQKTVVSYNRTFHRSLGTTPASVTKEREGESRLQQYLLRPKIRPSRAFTFDEGQTVRISHVRSAFDREYSQKWTDEVFVIDRRYKREGLPVYRLKDWSGDAIEGTFYAEELQAVNVDERTEYRVEKILKRRTSGKRKEVLVRWLHWPSKYDSWILERDLKLYS